MMCHQQQHGHLASLLVCCLILIQVRVTLLPSSLACLPNTATLV